MQDIVIDIGVMKSLAEAYRRAPDLVAQEFYVAMLDATALLERESKELAPTATGLLRGSIFGEARATESGSLGVVGSPLQHAEYVELGTRPHFPPIEPLMDWVAVKFGISDEQQQRSIATAIAWKIFHHGTRSQLMFRRTFYQNEAQIESIFYAARDRIAARLPAA